MTVTEFYDRIGGDYADAMSRLLDEKRVVKYLNKFLSATDFPEMEKAIDESRWEEAFRFSHNLKGVALNLSLKVLAASSSELCERFRHGPPEGDFSDLREQVRQDYALVISLIGEISL